MPVIAFGRRDVERLAEFHERVKARLPKPTLKQRDVGAMQTGIQ
jgi:hypothetical protein